jgi:HipA-like protein
MSDQLSVFYDGRTVGTLTLLESQQMQFEYSSEWSSEKSSFPISISLPLDASFDPTTSHRFFANLLPEANVRLQICRMLGISPDNSELRQHFPPFCDEHWRINGSRTNQAQPSADTGDRSSNRRQSCNRHGNSSL